MAAREKRPKQCELSPSGIAKFGFEYISIRNEFSNTLGKRKEIRRPLFKSFQRAQRHPTLLPDCPPRRGQSRGPWKSWSFGLSPEQRQAGHAAARITTVCHYFESAAKAGNDLTCGEIPISRRKRCRKIELSDNWEHRWYKPVSRATCFLPYCPSKLRSDVSLNLHFADHLTSNEGGKL